jgi:NADH/NAD ratio-sensing transcriptional regulator Rex
VRSKKAQGGQTTFPTFNPVIKTSKDTMLKHFSNLEEHLDAQDTELTVFIPARREGQDICNVLLKLNVFEPVSEKLQDKSVDLLEHQ